MSDIDYFLAPAAVTLRDEVNAAFPKRDKASDGWIGDASHAARKSSHNPCWTCSGRAHGIVRGLDIDISPDGRPDADLAKVVLQATIGDPRVWYVIHDGKIYSRTFGWQPMVYTGSNPHREHVHVSLNGANGVSGEGNFDTSGWGIADIADGLPKDPILPAVSLAAAKRAAAAPRRAVAPVAVRRIQRALNARLGLRLEVDGVYGPATRTAMRQWQRRIDGGTDGLPHTRNLTRLGANRFRVTP